MFIVRPVRAVDPPRPVDPGPARRGSGAGSTTDRRLSREVEDWRRARLIDAAIDVRRAAGERPTATAIILRAGVSRKTFYDQFTDTEDCMLAVLEYALRCLEQPLQAGRQAQVGWLEGIRAAASALLAALDEERELARIVLLDSLRGGPRILARRTQMLESLADCISPPPSGSGAPVAQPVALANAGGVLELLAHRLLRDGHAPLSALYGTVMSLIVLPHRGPVFARRELTRPAPPPPVTPVPDAGAAAVRRALHGLGTRLTYRTMRVLVAVADAPGASNRSVAEAAGVADPGQISKLLKRLAALGLIENRGPGQPSGAANSWWLTAQGSAIQRTA